MYMYVFIAGSASDVLIIPFLLKYVRVCMYVLYECLNDFNFRSLSKYGGHGDMDPAALQRLYETQVSALTPNHGQGKCVMNINYIPRHYAIHLYTLCMYVYMVHIYILYTNEHAFKALVTCRRCGTSTCLRVPPTIFSSFPPQHWCCSPAKAMSLDGCPSLIDCREGWVQTSFHPSWLSPRRWSGRRRAGCRQWNILCRPETVTGRGTLRKRSR